MVGAGDDCALIEAGDDYLAFSADLSVEGVHFHADWGTPELIGQRALRAAASDLAAMGAEPLGALVAINIPRKYAQGVAVHLGAGCRNAAEAVGLSIIGGDVSRGGSDITLDVVVIGAVKKPLMRGGARPGDELWVTGELGAAAAAARAWIGGREPEPKWRQRFWTPKPRIEQGRWLAEHGAVAAIDLSDGLVSDAGHIAAASGVRLEIDAPAVPVAENVTLQLALSGGEDYELLVAAPFGIFGKDLVQEFEDAFRIPLSRVGRAVVGDGVRVFGDEGEELKLAKAGHDHFA